MSRIAFTGNALGTGTVTMAAPNTNTDQTVTLPDQTGTLYISGGNIGTPSGGNGSNLTNLNASNLASGTVPDARFPATLPAASGVNLTALNASNLSSGTVPDARFPATLPASSGVNLTALNASNLGSGTVPTARLASGTANSTTFLRGDQTWATAGGAPSAIDAIGSMLFVAVNTTSTLMVGSTIAGSSLFYVSSVTNFGNGLSEGANTSSLPRTSWRYFNESFGGSCNRTTSGNTGYTSPGGSTALSGTWRILTPTQARFSVFAPCFNVTDSVNYTALAVRIA